MQVEAVLQLLVGAAAAAAPQEGRGEPRLPRLRDPVLVYSLKRRLSEDFTITEKAPTRAFSWLKVPTSAFTLMTLLRHYAMLNGR